MSYYLACQLGHVEAQYEFGIKLIGQAQTIREAFKCGLDWLESAARKGHLQAQLELIQRSIFDGRCLRNPQLILEWLGKANEQNPVATEFFLRNTIKKARKNEELSKALGQEFYELGRKNEEEEFQNLDPVVTLYCYILASDFNNLEALRKCAQIYSGQVPVFKPHILYDHVKGERYLWRYERLVSDEEKEKAY